MGSLAQLRLIDGRICGPTLQERRLFGLRHTHSAVTGGINRCTDSTGRALSLRCENRKRGGFLKPLSRPSRNLWFDPLTRDGKCPTTRGGAVEDGAKAAPLSAGVTEQSENEKEEELSTATLLWRAAKLPIYSVCIIPLTVGAAAAYWQTGVFNGSRYWLMLWSSVLVITWLNLSNDAYDAETGVDKYKKESVVNITGSQKGVLWAAFGCLFCGLAGLITGASQAGDMRVAFLLVLAIACGYVYQCPPFRLSYKGLGEPLCFFAFGPLATTAFYLSQAQASAAAVLPVTVATIGASVLVGITTSLILFCSHFHQIEGDTAAGKLSPLVRLGTESGAKVVQGAVLGLYTIVAALSLSRSLPLTCPFFALLTVPIGKLVVEFVQKNHTVVCAVHLKESMKDSPVLNLKTPVITLSLVNT
ncbi:hypothetical protein AXG93_4242s1280 [Marchantia polymorpha subsp. ruderalis]|uniref:2-carboxy-1,4-naphthoquinone phytyltransferase, chloroplastic n=1 Tax=Marchantia polymorpha subsp. ruderalis TaxID=1480154 RepID=A0A176VY81_MARPO|nr:hypothetical protein AXG93_4242s1280 [Marchantia polymorpha subsp. ruderalis]